MQIFQKLMLLRHIPGALWRLLQPDYQRNVKSFAWGFSTHLMLLVILAIIIFPKPPEKRISIIASLDNNDTAVAEFTLTEELDVIDPTAETFESLDAPVAVELPEPVIPLLEEVLAPVGAGSKVIPVENSIENGTVESSDLFSDSQLNPETQALVSKTYQRVRNAGGSLEGIISVSLMYDGPDDLDLSVSYRLTDRKSLLAQHKADIKYRSYFPPLQHETSIWYGNPKTEYGQMDVDANSAVVVLEPCENIIFTSVPIRANYNVKVTRYRARQSQPVHYVVVVRVDKKIFAYQGVISQTGGFHPLCAFQYP